VIAISAVGLVDKRELVATNATLPTDLVTAPSSANSRMRQPDTTLDSRTEDRMKRQWNEIVPDERGLRLSWPPLHSQR
jgi:hypothetical protein